MSISKEEFYELRIGERIFIEGILSEIYCLDTSCGCEVNRLNIEDEKLSLEAPKGKEANDKEQFQKGYKEGYCDALNKIKKAIYDVSYL